MLRISSLTRVGLPKARRAALTASWGEAPSSRCWRASSLRWERFSRSRSSGFMVGIIPSLGRRTSVGKVRGLGGGGVTGGDVTGQKGDRLIFRRQGGETIARPRFALLAVLFSAFYLSV